MFPRETMPLGIFLIGYLIPVTYFWEVLRGIIIRGATMAEMWNETLVLLVFLASDCSFEYEAFQKNLILKIHHDRR